MYLIFCSLRDFCCYCYWFPEKIPYLCFLYDNLVFLGLQSWKTWWQLPWKACLLTSCSSEFCTPALVLRNRSSQKSPISLNRAEEVPKSARSSVELGGKFQNTRQVNTHRVFSPSRPRMLVFLTFLLFERPEAEPTYYGRAAGIREPGWRFIILIETRFDFRPVGSVANSR